jgi:polar amino acid transport system substrate-binding protein
MSPRNNAGTILLADDEALVRKNAIAILSEANFEVIEAVDGADAWAKFQAFQDDISLTVMDLKMPKLNGLDAAKRIRELEHFAKIIFISGSTLHTPAEELADAFLTKPLRGRDLLNAVRRVLRQTNLQGPLANGL